MAKDWTPRDYTRLLVSSTACLCLLIVTGGGVIGVLIGIIPVEAIGSMRGLSIGGGFVALGLIAYQVIRIALR